MDNTISLKKGTSASCKRKIIDSENVRQMNEVEKNAFREFLLKNRAVQLQVINDKGFYKNFAPPFLPLHFGCLYNKTMVGKSYEEVIEECEKLLDGPLLHCSQEQADNVNLWTVGQKKTKLWDTYRAGRCTASNAKNIVTSNLNDPALWLIKKCCYPADNHFSTEATRFKLLQYFL